MPGINAQTAATQRAVLAMKDRLAEVAINEIVTHAELQSLVPTDLSYLSHYVLAQRAQRLLNAEIGAVFATVRGEGYRRLAHGTGADYATDVALLRIRSQSRRGQRLATMAIKFGNDVTDNEKRKVYQKLASLGLIEHLTMAKSVRTMPEDEPQSRSDPLAGLRSILSGTEVGK